MKVGDRSKPQVDHRLVSIGRLGGRRLVTERPNGLHVLTLKGISMHRSRKPTRFLHPVVVWTTVATAAMVGLAGFASSNPAGAGSALRDAKGSVTCTGISGKIKFDPPLTLSGGSSVTKAVAKVKATLTGCTSSKGDSPSIGMVTTKIVTKNPNGKANACTGLETPRPVSLTIQWTNPKAVAPSTVSFSSYAIGSNSAGDEGFVLPGSGGTVSITGSYKGKNGGASSTAAVYSNKTASSLASACTSPNGLGKLKLTGGSATLK